MSIEAVVFDIGGVLEINPRTGWPERWAPRVGLSADEFERVLGDLWQGGSTGELGLGEIERLTWEALSLDELALRSMMDEGGLS